MKEKVKSMLLGLHVGDSLGATLEFQKPNPKDQFQREILGGGVFKWKKGAATDDTDMMMALLRVLVTYKNYNHQEVIKKFIAWKNTRPLDIGNTVKEALMLQEKYRYQFSGFKGDSRKSNGSLMRCAPLALLDFNKQIINQQTSITHGSEVCLLADEIFIKSLHDALIGKDKQEIFKNAKKAARRSELEEILYSLDHVQYEDLHTSGYVVHTLACAFWALMNFNTFEEGLIHVINKGADSDTCGAVSGALLGAYYQQIPERWLGVIEYNKEIQDLVDLFYS